MDSRSDKIGHELQQLASKHDNLSEWVSAIDERLGLIDRQLDSLDRLIDLLWKFILSACLVVWSLVFKDQSPWWSWVGLGVYAGVMFILWRDKVKSS